MRSLFSRSFDIIFDGPGTAGGGVGLGAKDSCSSEVIVLQMIGLLEPCSREQSEQLRCVLKLASLYQTHENSVSGYFMVRQVY